MKRVLSGDPADHRKAIEFGSLSADDRLQRCRHSGTGPNRFPSPESQGGRRRRLELHGRSLAAAQELALVVEDHRGVEIGPRINAC